MLVKWATGHPCTTQLRCNTTNMICKGLHFCRGGINIALMIHRIPVAICIDRDQSYWCAEIICSLKVYTLVWRNVFLTKHNKWTSVIFVDVDTDANVNLTFISRAGCDTKIFTLISFVRWSENVVWFEEQMLYNTHSMAIPSYFCIYSTGNQHCTVL